jgi:hypothetical protein
MPFGRRAFHVPIRIDILVVDLPLLIRDRVGHRRNISHKVVPRPALGSTVQDQTSVQGDSTFPVSAAGSDLCPTLARAPEFEPVRCRHPSVTPHATARAALTDAEMDVGPGEMRGL